MIEVGGVIVHSDILTERFGCDLQACRGACCVEGDAGAPVTLDEIAAIEEALPQVEPMLSRKARAIIREEGVAYADRDGELVTSIVDGRDCVFTIHEGGTCYCALEKAFREGRTHFCKPISCALYPIREKKIGSMTGLNYHRWDICKAARCASTPVYAFLREPLVRRFGQEWYDELCAVADELKKQKLI